MASQFFLSLILFFFLTSPQPSSSAPDIQQACKATRFPAACESSLTNSPKSSSQAGSLQIITSAINVSSQNLHTAQSMVQSVLKTHGNPNRTHASQNCVNFLQSSDYWTSLTTTKALPHQRIKDGRAWLTAALQYQYDCWSALKYANDTQLVNQTMSFLNSSLMVSTSNALSMLFSYDNYGKDTATWAPPKTERDGFWEAAREGVAGAGLSAGVPTNLKADVTVCKDGAGGCLKTVQEAVNKAPDNVWSRKFVIHIKAGVYQETVRVPLPKKNVVFLGDGIGKTVITGSLNSGVQGITTFNTATVGVDGEGFMARDITFENKGGPEAHQAVAFRSDSDLSVLENCEFLGNQDTLYSHTLRQFYKSCHIQGNVDFIFGNSAAVFQDCQILIRPRQADPDKGESNTVTAHGRIDPAMTAGYVFQNCSVDGTKEYMQFYNSKPKNHKNYLGRPWKEYSRTVFINSRLGALISPDGWMPWDDDFALKTLYYGEYGNTGPGSNVANRVPWSSQIPAKNVGTYSLNNFV